MTQPDLAGFRAAQERLNEEFGAEVTFSIPAPPEDVTWPEDTGIDPETGFPFDPTIEPEAGGDPTTVEARAEVVHRTQATDAVLGALGWLEDASMALIVLPEVADDIQGATEVTVFNERQRIMVMRPDGIQPDQVDRWIVFTEGL